MSSASSSSSSSSSPEVTAMRRAAAILNQLQPNVTANDAKQSANAFFAHVKEAPPDEIFNTAARYKADPSSSKVDLGIGAYRTDEGKPLVLNVVRKAEEIIARDPSLNKEYLAIDGDAKFVTHARTLLFGADSVATREKRIATAQCLSGTGSLRTGVEFIANHFPKGTTILYSNPTWGNHKSIFASSGPGVPSKQYRYWDAANRKLDINGFLSDLNAAAPGSVVLLHACAHNPTGVDPTREQWKQIAVVMKAKNLLPFFDSAYQGFASGDLDNDAWAIRYFVDQGFEMIAAQSFAKNFGLYNERVGTVSVVTSTPQAAVAVLSQIKMIARPNYSNPPAHGARIAALILSDKQLYNEWVAELKGMAGRIHSMRGALKGELLRLGTPGNWDHITSQIGMFSFTGLNAKQCEHLITKHHIYLLSNGRISMAGINSKNVKYVAAAMDDAVKNVR